MDCCHLRMNLTGEYGHNSNPPRVNDVHQGGCNYTCQCNDHEVYSVSSVAKHWLMLRQPLNVLQLAAGAKTSPLKFQRKLKDVRFLILRGGSREIFQLMLSDPSLRINPKKRQNGVIPKIGGLGACQVVLQEARYHHLQNCFGYVEESSRLRPNLRDAMDWAISQGFWDLCSGFPQNLFDVVLLKIGRASSRKAELCSRG